jgi:hypothetical protein
LVEAAAGLSVGALVIELDGGEQASRRWVRRAPLALQPVSNERSW